MDTSPGRVFASRGRPERILVVEDDDDLRFVVSLRLRARGYAVDEAWDLRSAREALEAAAPDAAVIDIMLGSDRGDDLALDLLGRDPSVALVFVSASAELATVVEHIYGPNVMALVKPVEGTVLDLHLERLLAARRRSRRAVEMLADMSLPGGLAALRRSVRVELARARRYGRHFSVVLVTLSGPIHWSLDDEDREPALLTLRRLIRRCDSLVHLNSRLALLLLPETSIEGARVLRGRICSALDPIVEGRGRVQIEILAFPRDEARIQDLVRAPFDRLRSSGRGTSATRQEDT